MFAGIQILTSSHLQLLSPASVIVGNIIPKSVKCVHSATKP